MANSRMLQSELDKTSLDREMAQIEVNNAKNRFAEELAGLSYRTLAAKSKKYKYPLKFKIKEKLHNFNEQLKIFFGL